MGKSTISMGHISQLVNDEWNIITYPDLWPTTGTFTYQGTSHALPLLLGPGTEAFRTAAAQVAQDYQRPMILWSIPKEGGGARDAILPENGGFVVIYIGILKYILSGNSR